MAQGVFEITADLLVDLLHLPPGTKINRASGDARAVSLIVSHPDIKPDGSIPAKLCPEFLRLDQDSVKFLGWGQK